MIANLVGIKNNPSTVQLEREATKDHRSLLALQMQQNPIHVDRRVCSRGPFEDEAIAIVIAQGEAAGILIPRPGEADVVGAGVGYRDRIKPGRAVDEKVGRVGIFHERA